MKRAHGEEGLLIGEALHPAHVAGGGPPWNVCAVARQLPTAWRGDRHTHTRPCSRARREARSAGETGVRATAAAMRNDLELS
jgi:hypothetical protein